MADMPTTGAEQNARRTCDPMRSASAYTGAVLPTDQPAGIRFSLMLPSVGPNEVLDADSLAELARVAEAAGLDACSVTDHPMPMDRADRHTGLDPFAALTHVAAATERLLLHTGVIVLPYRNPFLVAQGAATVNYLSGGRLILGLGSGYLAEEFAALGVDIAERGALMDEGIPALRAAWAGGPVTTRSSRWVAGGNIPCPPVDGPGPPIWLGGNGRSTRRRATSLAQGWSPFETPPGSRAVGQSIAGIAELGPLIEDLRRMEAEQLREEPLEICFVRPMPTWLERPESAVQEEIRELEDLGVDWLVVRLEGRDGSEIADRVRWFAALAGR